MVDRSESSGECRFRMLRRLELDCGGSAGRPAKGWILKALQPFPCSFVHPLRDGRPHYR